MSLPTKRFKRPESVLVLVYTLTGKVLLLRRTGTYQCRDRQDVESGLIRRADDPDFWQSVTGSLLWEETEPRQAAIRELREETGLEAKDVQDAGVINRYTILPQWRHRYAPEVQENTEYVFFLVLPAEKDIALNATEHTEYGWYSFDAAASKVFSWTNREAILKAKAQH